MVKKHLFLLFVTQVFLYSCSSKSTLGVQLPAVEEISDSPSGDAYRIQISDSVEVFVLEDSSFNGQFNVRSSGDIIMPKVGRIKLQGLGLKQAEAEIKKVLELNHLRLATVIVDPGAKDSTDTGLIVRMSGSVQQTGRISIKRLGSGHVTAYQAIVEAGGFKPFAAKKKAYILRQTQSGMIRINVNFDAIETGAQADVPLAAGDCIVVPEKTLGF